MVKINMLIAAILVAFDFVNALELTQSYHTTSA